MNLQKALLAEHSRRQADKIAGYACRSKKHFKELMNYFLSDNQLLSRRAAWSLSIVAVKLPEYVFPHVKDLVSVLSRKDIHPAVIRHSVSMLERIEIPEKFHGKVMQACFQFLENNSIPVAIKVFSMTTLYNLSRHYPEIKSELRSIIEDRWERESPAFKSRGKKVLLQIK